MTLSRVLGRLAPEFQVCQIGREQPPIDLQTAIVAEPETPTIPYTIHTTEKSLSLAFRLKECSD